MRFLRGLIERLRCLSRRSRVERELREEIDFHLERETARNRAAGMGPEQARHAAHQAFGRVEQIKELHRDERGVRWMQDLAQDLRYGLRGLRAAPGLAAVAVLALALGIGGNSAMFSVLDAILIRPLPFHEPDRVAVLWQVQEERGGHETMSPYDFRYFQEHAQALSGMAAFRPPDLVILHEESGPEQITATRVTTGFFDVLGAHAALGRTFSAEDEAAGPARTAVLTHAFWQRRFHGDPDVVGQPLQINGSPAVVVGVMPETFRFEFPSAPDLWLTRVFSEQELDEVNYWSERVLGRLAPGVSREEAREELRGLLAGLYEERPRDFRAHDFNPVPVREELVAEVRPALVFLLGAVALVLLIACVNVANLLLARNARRQHELGLRAALGASRTRLTRQLLAEFLVLGGLGGIAAVAVGQVLLRAMLYFAPADLPRLAEIGMDLRVVAFTGAVALLTTLVFGTLPALRGGRTDVSATSCGNAQRGELGGSNRLLSALVAAESALVIVLLVAAATLLQGYRNLRQVDPGFRTDSRIAAEIVLPAARYPTPEPIAELFAEITTRLESQPGIEAVGGAATLPLSGREIVVRVPPIEGVPEQEPPLSTGWDSVTPGYFDAMGIPLLSGRTFDAGDDVGSEPVMMVNQALARAAFDGLDPVGRYFLGVGSGAGMRWRIVGVVGDIVHAGLDEKRRPRFYQPQTQVGFAWPRFEIIVGADAEDPMSLADTIRRVVREVDPDQPVASIRPLAHVTSDSVRQERFQLALLVVFGGVALALGVIGIYGVVSYRVASQTPEMGLRLALGASLGDIRRRVVWIGLRPVVSGLALGVLTVVAFGGVVERLAYEATPTSPLLLTAVAALLVLTAAAATLLPAQRATRTDPLDSLRAD